MHIIRLLLVSILLSSTVMAADYYYVDTKAKCINARQLAAGYVSCNELAYSKIVTVNKNTNIYAVPIAYYYFPPKKTKKLLYSRIKDGAWSSKIYTVPNLLILMGQQPSGNGQEGL